MNSGIYQIMNKTNGKRYIGSAVDIRKRWRAHFADLCYKSHHSRYLQHAWEKYGEENFVFEIIENCEKSNLIDREQYYFDVLKPEYNICKIAGNTAGVQHFGESNSFYGKKHSTETKLRISRSLSGQNSSAYGKQRSDETKRKISESEKGKYVSKETKEKIRLANVGKRCSDETKSKMQSARLAYLSRIKETI